MTAMNMKSSNDNHLEMISGVGELAEKYDVFFLDVWGVLYNGVSAYPTVVPCLQKLRDAGKKTCLVSNTPSRSIRITEAYLKDSGITRDTYDEIITAGESCFMALRDRYDDFHQSCGNKCFFIGQDHMFEAVQGLDLEFIDDPAKASFVMNALGGMEATEEESLYAVLNQCLEHNLPMVCSNPDIVVNVGSNQYPCAGTYAQFYENNGGRVAYHGKPYAPIYEQARNLMDGTDKSRIVAIGDSLHTDIQGANNFGVDSVFNLVGIHWEEVRLDHAPEEADIEKVRTMVEAQPHHPKYVMAGFKW